MAAPQTGFEQRGKVAPWTSLEEEATFLSTLDAYTSRISVSVVGESVEGRPIRVVRLGTGPRHVVHIAAQHGNEPSGREAWLSLVRDWATSADPAIVSYLQRVTVHVIPSANPDGLFDSRNNKGGANLNRDHIALSQPETQAIHAVLRDARPDLFVDWHESDGSPVEYSSSEPINANVDPAIRSLGASANLAVRDAIVARGEQWQVFPQTTDVTIMRTFAGLQGAVSLVMEAEMDTGDFSDAHLRHARQMDVANAVRAWHHARIDEVADAVEATWNRWSSGVHPVTLESESSGPVVTPPELGYRVSVDDWERLALHRDRFGIRGRVGAGGYVIDTTQPAQPIVAYLVDPQSPVALIRGVPVEPPRPPVPIPATGYRLFYHHRGTTYPATLKVKA